MPIWDGLSVPWRACVEEAWAAYSAGCMPIGAVVVRAGKIASRGRNRVQEVSRPGEPLSGTAVAHAEIVALSALSLAQCGRQSALYVTTAPCPMCIGAIRMAWLGELRYASRDPLAGSVRFLKATPFMRISPVATVGPQDGKLERVLVAMLVTRLLEMAPPRYKSAVETWSKVSPEAVSLGHSMHADRSLRRMADAEASAEEAISAVESMLT